jgi:hypothetical protein
MLVLGVSRCSIDHTGIRSDDQEKKQLEDTAQQYWNYVRWGYMEQAVTFVEHEEDRARHQVLLEDISKTKRITNVTILQTSVASPDNPSSPDEQGRWRTGLVRVRVEGYTLPAQIVQLDETSQDWYRTSKGWFIDIDD